MENVTYLVWTCSDPISVSETQLCLILRTQIGSLKCIKKAWSIVFLV